MILMTFDTKPISQSCTPEAIAKKISVSSPRVVMLSISITVSLGVRQLTSVALYTCITWSTAAVGYVPIVNGAVSAEFSTSNGRGR